MKFSILVVSLAALFFISCKTQKYTVAFYNTENLFDTIDTPNKIDEEFLPSSTKQWNTERYTKKINDLGHVIEAIDSVNYPAIVGLCEVENDIVLNDLAKSNFLSKAGYQIVWHDGPDVRGIDCAMLYDPKRFHIIHSEFVPVVNPNDSTFATREIVHVTGKMAGETFDVFVNHWPSRRGGEEGSVPLRGLAATVLRSKVDEVIAANPNPNIVIMGDFNDEPGDSSVTMILKAYPNDKTPEPTELVNLMYDEYSRKEGSYNYRGTWNMLDNLIVSGNLVTKKKGLKTTLDDGHVFHLPFMEFVSDKGEMSPNRTYGRTYFGGISDHFPVYLILKK
jgi:predicted extracellular nuclease